METSIFHHDQEDGKNVIISTTKRSDTTSSARVESFPRRRTSAQWKYVQRSNPRSSITKLISRPSSAKTRDSSVLDFTDPGTSQTLCAVRQTQRMTTDNTFRM